MLTPDRASAIATAVTSADLGELLGSLTPEDLLALVTADLGHPDILDNFQPVGSIRSKAIPPAVILHVISGNTPHAGLQSLIRGLLLGAKRNLCKIPGSGLPAIAQFKAALPPALADTIEIASDLPDTWLRDAHAVVVYGDDDTIAHFRRSTRPSQKFIAHGHKLSFSMIFDTPGPDSPTAALAATDVSLFDQQGCLSPHTIYLHGDAAAARDFASQLAGEMARFEAHTPRRQLSPAEDAEIENLRAPYRFRAANDPRVALFESDNSTAWTVLFEDDPQFAVSPLNRFVFVKPLPPAADWPEHFRLVRPHLSTAAIWPFSLSHADALASLGVTRICPLGQAQHPSPFWHPDGQSPLASLVHWVGAG